MNVYVLVWICTFHISTSGYGTICVNLAKPVEFEVPRKTQPFRGLEVMEKFLWDWLHHISFFPLWNFTSIVNLSYLLHLGKAWTAIDILMIIWKSDLSDQIKWEFFQVVAVLVLLYSYTTWTRMKHLTKKLHANYTKILHTVLKQDPTKYHLYGYLPPVQVRHAKHTGHCWRSKDELMSDILLWTSTHGHTNVGWLAKTYIHLLFADTGCCCLDN